MKRDMVGYGRNRPKVVWPGGARVAISFVINYEEGSELTPYYGDDRHELSGDIRSSRPPDVRDYQTESQWEYGSRSGVWRMLRLFDKYQLKVTFFLCAMALEQNPELASAIVDHDICGHGHRWIPQWQLTRDEEAKYIAAAVESIQRMTNRHPRGWFTKGGPSENTRELLAEQGFLYDSDGLNDDLPYYTHANGRPWLVVPYTFDTNDGGYWQRRWSSGEDFSAYLRRSFDYLYGEGETNPALLNIGLHSKVSGRPGRTAALEEFIQHVLGFPNVWIAGRTEIAEWWLSQYPPESE